MHASGKPRSALRLAAALWGLGAGTGQSQAVSPLIVKPKPVCMGPRRPSDPSIPAPEVVSSYPAEGAVVRPGYVVIRFTFNVAMSCDGVFLTPPPPRQLPCAADLRQDVLYSYDRRTLQMTCRVDRNTRYALRLNYDPTTLDAARLSNVAATRVRFMSVAGSPLKPFELAFSTSSGPGNKTEKDALAEEIASEAPAK